MKNKVIIDFFNNEEPEKVSVFDYDNSYNIIGDFIEVTTSNNAYKKYQVVAEVIDGEIRNFNLEEEEYDYYSEFGIEEDD